MKLKPIKPEHENLNNMKLGIISDTHDNIDTTRRAIEFFEKEEVDKVLHCGDMVAPFTAKLFDSESFDFYAVRGNNDGEPSLKQTVNNFGKWLGEIGKLNIGDERLAVYHGTKPKIVRALIDSGDYDYVFRGHTHEKKINKVDGTVELNPGGIKLPSQDENLHVVIMDLKAQDFNFHEIEG